MKKHSFAWIIENFHPNTGNNRLMKSLYIDSKYGTINHVEVDYDLLEYITERLQKEIKSWFIYNDILYSGYIDFLGYFRYDNEMYKNHVIILISKERFAGAVYKEGKIALQKTIYRKGCDITKTTKVTRENFVKNSFVNDRVGYCIESLLTYYEPKTNIVVLYHCPKNFEGIFREYVREIRNNTSRSYISFPTGEPLISEVEKVYEIITTVTEHCQMDEFDTAVKEKNREFFERKIVPHAKILVPYYNEEIFAMILPEAIKEIHKAILTNNERQLHKLPAVLRCHSDYLERRHAKFGGITLLHFATREGLLDSVKFLLSRCRSDIPDYNGQLPIDYCRTLETLELFREAEKSDEEQCEKFKKYYKIMHDGLSRQSIECSRGPRRL